MASLKSGRKRRNSSPKTSNRKPQALIPIIPIAQVILGEEASLPAIQGSSVPVSPAAEAKPINQGLKQTIEREIQARLFPKPGDPLYLHLADLLLVMRKAATSESVTILDYGAGLAPYRSLFPNSQYRTADVAL